MSSHAQIYLLFEVYINDFISHIVITFIISTSLPVYDISIRTQVSLASVQSK